LQTPEQLARQTIDALLGRRLALQDRDQFDRNRRARRGGARIPAAGRALRLPAVRRRQGAGVIEAKKTGVTLSGVAEQSGNTCCACRSTGPLG